MLHLTGTDRGQTFLLAESFNDHVGQDNPVRFIEAFVGALILPKPTSPV